MSENRTVRPSSYLSLRTNRAFNFLLLTISCLIWFYLNQSSTKVSEYKSLLSQCPDLGKVVPQNGYDLSYFKTPEFRNLSLNRFQGILKIPTESSHDYEDPRHDARWDIFTEQERFLQETFPLTHKHLSLEIVNGHGLVYTWKGRFSALKPALLTSHLDVVAVPEDLVDEWTYKPYEAYFDGYNIWARGALDAKHPLMSIFEAAEELLTRNFVPNRDIIFAFGFDEESRGRYGAATIARYLEEKYGKNSFEVLLDEGGMSVTRSRGANLAVVSVGEKGFQQTRIVFHAQGGHSSLAPLHTGIGIIAELITVIEKHEFPYSLNEPTLSALECVALNSDSLGWLQKQIILRARTSSIARFLLIRALSKTEMYKNMIQTSQAVTMIQGGSSINALPEVTTIYIDHRVAVDSSLDSVRSKVESDVLKIAEKYNTGIKGFSGEWLRKSDTGEFFEIFTHGFEGSPAAASSAKTETWKTFAQTVKRVYEDFGGELTDITSGEKSTPRNITVVPGLHTMNTDTRYYLNLTENVYRFIPIRIDDHPNLHAADEHISLDAHIEGIAFYFEYMQNL